MELWIPITIAAAFFQNLRSALQKHLRGRLSTLGTSYSRFCFAAPFSLLYLIGLASYGDVDVPSANARFVFFCLVGGGAQIIGATLLVYLFSLRNFAVGATYSKTEVIQTALFGVIILGDPLSAAAATAILVSLVGVMTLSIGKGSVSGKSLLFAWTERSALLGIAIGTCYAIAAVSFRAASLSLGGEGILTRAALTLVWVTVFQTFAMGAYLGIKEPGQLMRVIRAWPVAILGSLSGVLSSACWFTAYTIQTAAYVSAVGQIELVFSFVASVLFFRERSNVVEVVGIVLVVTGLLILVLA